MPETRDIYKLEEKQFSNVTICDLSSLAASKIAREDRFKVIAKL